MELSKEEAYDILDLQCGAAFETIIRKYKLLALQWYPDKHAISSDSLNKFQLISQAFLTLCSTDEPCKRNLLTFEEMLSLFQFIFFRNENIDDDNGELSDSSDDSSPFEEFYVDWDFDDVGLANELSSLAIQDDASTSKENDYNEIENHSPESKAAQNAIELIQEEEREKKKSKKRKAQKKRRKEKKKQEKKDEMAQKKQNTNDDHDGIASQEDISRAQGDSSSEESEEDIDPESAFVATIAKKTNMHVPLKKEVETKSKSPAEADLKAEEESSSRVLRGRQLALRGNQMASSGYYHEAIELFSEAIKLDPTDHRFYGNRSYCSDRLGNYERALKDAEKSVSLAPEVPKGHFRKGKALSSLKRYVEAEKCFKEVLERDPACEDAVKELSEVQIKQIMDMGFSREQAENAISTVASVEGALELLLPTAAAAAAPLNKNEDVFHSDEEDDFFIDHVKTVPAGQVLDAKLDPGNPEGHNSIWVGNLQSSVTEKMILSLFTKYGEILSIKFSPEKFYAFVNYKNKDSTGKAMRALQGLELFGSNLLIRYPNTKPSTTKPSFGIQDPTKAKIFVAPVNGDECYFWRTQGCIHGDNCRFKHIKDHKGIDNKKKVTQRF